MIEHMLSLPGLSAALTFMVSLPIAVLVAAALCGLAERPVKVNPLLRLVNCSGLIIGLLLLTDANHLAWVSAAFITVLGLHGLRDVALRARMRLRTRQQSQPY